MAVNVATQTTAITVTSPTETDVVILNTGTQVGVEAQTIPVTVSIYQSGRPGKEVEFQTTTTHVQWRYKDDGTDWVDLIALADIQGDPASNLVVSVNDKQGVVVLNKTDVGLSNVDNTSDLNKPISTATQAALDTKSDVAHLHDDRYYTETETDSLLSGKANTLHTHTTSDITDLQGALDAKANLIHSHEISEVNGLQAALNSKSDATETNNLLANKADLVSGKIPTAQIPNIAITDFLGEVADATAMLALTGEKGDWCIRTDVSKVFIVTGDDVSILSNWTSLSYPLDAVSSVNGQTGAVTLDYSDVGAQAALSGIGFVKISGDTISYDNTNYLSLAGGTMTGNLLFTDNTYDIGASAATRPRTGYFGTSIVSPKVMFVNSSGTNISHLAPGTAGILEFKAAATSTNSSLKIIGTNGASGLISVGSEDNGVVEAFRSTGTSVRMMENSSLDLNIWQFGGTTTTHPSLRVYGWNNAGTQKYYGVLQMGNGTTEGLTIQAYNNSDNANQDVYINPSGGNIGIGTSSLSGAKLTTAGSITASSALARGSYINTTLVAAANNDTLIGVDINPTFTNGSFTGVSNYALRTSNGGVLMTAWNSTAKTWLKMNQSSTDAESMSFFASASGTNESAGIKYSYTSDTAQITFNHNKGTLNGFITFHTNNGTALNEVARVTASGNMLIGTSVDIATYKLNVSNGGSESLQFAPAYAANVNYIKSYNQLSVSYNDLIIDTKRIRYFVSGSEKMRLDSTGGIAIGAYSGVTTPPANGLIISGNVGIGNDTPTANLQTGSSITATSGIGRGVFLNNTLIAAANNDVLVALDIAPTFTLGAFTGTTSWAIRTSSDVSINGVRIGMGKSNTSTNTVVGFDSGKSFSSGNSNTFVGYQSGSGMTTGYSNTLIGINVAKDATGIQNMTIIGAYAAPTLTNGYNCVIIGQNAGSTYLPSQNLSYLESSVFIGASTKAATNNDINEIVIGYFATGLGSNTVVLGNDNIVTTALKGSVLVGTTTSVPSSILTLNSTTKGFLPPRMAAAQASAISSPAEGLIVYVTDTDTTFTSKGWWGFNGVAWEKLNN